MKNIKERIEDLLIEKSNKIVNETGINHKDYYLYMRPDIYEEFESYISGFYVPAKGGVKLPLDQEIEVLKFMGYTLHVKLDEVLNEEGFNIIEKGLNR